MPSNTEEMIWSSQQTDAINHFKRWWESGSEQVYRLFGYAGSGKTTLAQELARSVSNYSIFCAFTGKAAYVLRQKGCDTAQTIHSLIYKPREKCGTRLKELHEKLEGIISAETAAGKTPDEIEAMHDVVHLRTQITEEKSNLKRPMFTLNLDSEVRAADLIIVDECSMVDESMGEDLESFGVPILVLGDPAQLPPVGGAGHFTNHEPDFLLTEVHRQAAKSPIIELATRTRNRRILSYGEWGGEHEGRYGLASVIPWRSVGQSIALDADQIIVGTNKLRREINHRVRTLLGRTHHLPVPGDKLVCLRNDHDVGLLNGSTWFVDEVETLASDRLLLTVNSETGEEVTCEAHAGHFLGEEIPYWDRREAQEFDFGYAQTCHKAQGSQWDKVLLFDESDVFRQHKWNWLYTAVTRAAKELVIAR